MYSTSHHTADTGPTVTVAFPKRVLKRESRTFSTTEASLSLNLPLPKTRSTVKLNAGTL